MAGKPFSTKSSIFLSKIFNKKTEKTSHFHRNLGHIYGLEDLLHETIMFHMEGVLLKSSSVFPYFMLVAFEAGGPLRALILLLLYPLVCLLSQDLGIKIMVFICFIGIKEKGFQVGSAVLSKFFLEDVGYEGFNLVMRGGRKIAVTDLPRVMVDGFLTDYLGVKTIVGRELKVMNGYFLGLMEANKGRIITLNEYQGPHIIAIGATNEPFDQQILSKCKAVYMVSEAEKRQWQTLSREKYPKPLIFHDGRLAFKPTPLATLAAITWFPFGIFLFIIRFILGELLPFKFSIPIFSFTGMRIEVTKSNSSTIQTHKKGKRGTTYVCNHRTVLDPIYVSLAITKPITAVVYSISKITEFVSPLKTVRLVRERVKDSEILENLLSKGDIVVCPEGTTCREPYLLRFSPLFSELSEEIVPIAINTHVSLFYGTTASGFKSLDPIFFFLNPHFSYSIEILEKIPTLCTSEGDEKSKYEIANCVQSRIAKALGFEGTNLTRKDKYMILTGNEGKVVQVESELKSVVKMDFNL